MTKNIFDEIKCQDIYKDFVKGMVWVEQRKLDGNYWRENWLNKRVKHEK